MSGDSRTLRLIGRRAALFCLFLTGLVLAACDHEPLGRGTGGDDRDPVARESGAPTDPALREARSESVLARNVGVSAPAGDGSREIRADLAWEASWRTSTPPGNWDAAWLFAKVRAVGEGGSASPWRHVHLDPDPGVHAVDEDHGVAPAFEPAPEGTGVFVHRAGEGRGAVRWNGVRLRWDSARDGIAPDAPYELRLFAVEMVFIPEGPFDVGDGVSPGRFHAGGDPAAPYRVTAAAPVLADAPGGLWADGTISPLPSGVAGPPPWDNPAGALPEGFPTGYGAIYAMKYEITQGLYVAFLNTLTPAQAVARYPTAQELGASRFRYTIAPDGAGSYVTETPTRAANWITWEDSIAFADWAGLRPMTELEFEKICRGAAPAVAGEYAWGTTRIVSQTGFEGVDGSGTEGALPPDSNTLFARTILGPVRAGIHEGKPTRELSGATYYGVLDMSGNVVEMAVSAGNAAGRRFAGTHGDGTLAAEGRADAATWPRAPAGFAAPVAANAGWGYRGGDFYNPELDLRVSARNVATFAGARRLFGLGFRAVRSAAVATSGAAAQPAPTPATTTRAAGPGRTLAVDFEDGTFSPLRLSYGPTDNPATANPAYTVEVRDRRAHFVAPAAAPGARLTGFLDLPADLVPIEGDLSFEWTFPDVAEVRGLGGGQSGATVIAGCYVRGAIGAWTGGLFGDYWFGYVVTGGVAVSTIRQGNANLVVEPFTAQRSVRYRLEKSGLTLRLYADYDGEGWHQVGGDMTIALAPGGSPAVAVTHVRVLDTSGAAIDVGADDFIWRWQ